MTPLDGLIDCLLALLCMLIDLLNRLFEGFQTEGFRFVLHASLAIFRWHSSAILSVIPGSLTSLLHAPCQEVEDAQSVDQFIASMAKIKLTNTEVPLHHT